MLGINKEIRSYEGNYSKNRYEGSNLRRLRKKDLNPLIKKYTFNIHESINGGLLDNFFDDLRIIIRSWNHTIPNLDIKTKNDYTFRYITSLNNIFYLKLYFLHGYWKIESYFIE